MANHYHAKLQSGSRAEITVNLQILEFKENDAIIIYSPHLDLSGYGDNLEDARKSFDIAMEDFFSYTLNKKTLGKVLKELGWTFKGTVRKPKKPKAPSFSTMVANNEYLASILDEHKISMYKKPIEIPVSA